jgi:hypothetical protein
MIDYNNLFKVGEINEVTTFLVKEYRKVPCVYLLRFGEEFYIGATTNLERRLNNHQNALRSRKGVCPPDLWDMLRLCEVYILYSFTEEETMNISYTRKLAQEEQRFCLLLSPTLNKMLPKGTYNPFALNRYTKLDLYKENEEELTSLMITRRVVKRNYGDQRTNWKFDKKRNEREKQYNEKKKQVKKQREKMIAQWDKSDPLYKSWEAQQEKTDKAVYIAGDCRIRFKVFHK